MGVHHYILGVHYVLWVLYVLLGVHHGRSYGFPLCSYLFGCPLYFANIQNAKINSVFSTIANDPDMQKASPREIRMSFEKRASVDEISAITSRDIDIASGDGVLELSANYSVTVPLFANINLLLEFNPSSVE